MLYDWGACGLDAARYKLIFFATLMYLQVAFNELSSNGPACSHADSQKKLNVFQQNQFRWQKINILTHRKNATII